MARTWQAHCKPSRTKTHSSTTTRSSPQTTRDLRTAIRIALAASGAALFAAGVPPALAAYAVNDPIVNPVTGATETVLVVSGDSPWVFTNQNHAIYVGPTAVGTTMPDPDDATKTLTIASVHVNDTTKLVDYVITRDGASPPNETQIDFVQSGDKSALPNPGGGDLPERDITLPDVPTGNLNLYRYTRVGSRGRDGDDGYGIHLWFFTIGVDPDDGGPGGVGPALDDSLIQIGNIDIKSISGPTYERVYVPDVGWKYFAIPVPGAWVISRGGDGGTGGDSYTLGTDNPGGLGGTAGKGGAITFTSQARITTSGEFGHGIMAQSIAGLGGAGGAGYLFNSGAQGGNPAEGGRVDVTNAGEITTYGDGADGMLIQSIGGGGGTGGGSYGIVGDSGGGNKGGNGGETHATNDGKITTMGDAAHGMVVQSIGGHGGDAGAAGGLVSFGGSGAGGGAGGLVYATNSAGHVITIGGDWSFGILAQSIGGGGGNGGTAGGIVGIGGSGAAGGYGMP